jgi:hypothetical protein
LGPGGPGGPGSLVPIATHPAIAAERIIAINGLSFFIRNSFYLDKNAKHEHEYYGLEDMNANSSHKYKLCLQDSTKLKLKLSVTEHSALCN